MNRTPLYAPEEAPFNGPQSLFAPLLSGALAAQVPFEGLWVPTNFLKYASVDVNGPAGSFSLSLLGSNSQVWPMNTYTVTVGGTITNLDVATLTFTAALLNTGTEAVHYNIVTADTTTTIAAGLAAAINADAALKALGITATSAAAIITVNWPSAAPVSQPGQQSSPTNPPFANSVSIAGSVTGGATETLTVGLGTDGDTLATITAVGMTAISPWPCRWVKARVTTLATSNTINANLHGVA